MSRRYLINRSDSLAEARRLREAFQDAPAKRETPVPWDWPNELQEVGECVAVMYASNKWQKNPKHFEDYKHLHEGPQRLYVAEGFLREHGSPSHELRVVGPYVELNRPMPDAFAVLAKILGVQARLYTGTDADPRTPSGDDGYYQIDIPGAHLGAAVHPETGETFLIVYTSDGVHCLITGDDLDVQKDGIVG